MTPQQKKDLVNEKLKNPDEKRSYNEIMADLELELWRNRFGRP